MRPSTFFADNAASFGDTFILEGPEAHHAIAAQRIRSGEVIDIVDGRGVRVRSRVAHAEGTHTLHCVREERTVEPETELQITVVQPLIKDGELAVELLTQVGVDVIVPWQAQHSIVQWRGERAAKAHTKWQHAAVHAAKQARRSHWPTIAPLATHDHVGELLASADCALMLEADAPVPIADVQLPVRGSVVLLLGPEGGLTPAELVHFNAALQVRLGPEVLRSAVAGSAAVIALKSQSSAWRKPPMTGSPV